MTLTPGDARRLLEQLGAPPHLIQHAALVLEAAEGLIARIEAEGVSLDADLVRSGAILHDAGKILHPGELHGPGNAHEPAGVRLLLANGVDPALARCCLSHARWAAMECSLEELVIALSDNLWKGKRNEALEKRVIAAVAAATGRDVWDHFVTLDTVFENIAAVGPERLARSTPGG